MSGVKLEGVQCVKDLGVTIASNLTFSQHCKAAACKANRMLSFIKVNFSLNLPMYISLVRPHLEYKPHGVALSPCKPRKPQVFLKI